VRGSGRKLEAKNLVPAWKLRVPRPGGFLPQMPLANVGSISRGVRPFGGSARIYLWKVVPSQLAQVAQPVAWARDPLRASRRHHKSASGML